MTIEIKKTLMESAEGLVEAAKQQIEERGYFDPLVVCHYADGRKDFLYPRYSNMSERAEALLKVNKHIRETGAIGTVSILETVFTPKGSTRELDSLFCCLSGPGVYQYEAWIFTPHEDGSITWGDHIGPEHNGKDVMITAFADMQ